MVADSSSAQKEFGPPTGPSATGLDAELADVPAGEQLAAFTGVLFTPSDIVEFRIIGSDRKTESQWFEVNAIATALPWLTMRNSEGRNIYCGLNPRSAKGARGDDSVPLARTVFVDIDDSALVHADILARVRAAGLPAPTMIVFSGHGWWIFWKLAAAISDMLAWRGMQESLISRLSGDRTIKNPERIGRVPGFVNWKPPAAKAYLAEIDATRVYDSAIFAPAEPAVKAEPAPGKASRPAGGASATMRYSAYVDAMPDAVSGGGAGEKLMFQVLAEAHRFGLSEADAWPIIFTYNNTRCFRHTGELWPWPEADLRRQLGRAKAEVEKVGEYGNHLQEVRAVRPAGAITPNGMPATPAASEPVLICMAEVKPVEINWLWHERVPVGAITILAGRPGEGKTMASIDFAARVTTGKPFPDGALCEVGNVLLISGEDDPAYTIRPRLDAHGADAHRVTLLRSVRHVVPGKPPAEVMFTLEDISILEQAITTIGGVRLLVIDPIGSFLGAKADAHRDNEVRGVLAPLALLAEKYSIAVLIVAHIRKASADHADDLILGSRAFTGIARSVLHISRDPEKKERRLMLPGKSNLAPEGSGLAFEICAGPVCVWESGPVYQSADDALLGQHRGPEPEARTAAEDWLCELLETGPVPATQVRVESKGAGFAWATLRRAADALHIKRRKCNFASGWEWCLAEGAHPPPQGAQPPPN